MISQGIPRFKIEHTEEQITPRSGLALFAEVIRALDVRRKVEGHFPKPGSNRGYEAWSYIEPVLLMLEGGGRHIEDLREIRDDAALRQLAGMGEMPSLSTYGDWLVWVGSGGGVAAKPPPCSTHGVMSAAPCVQPCSPHGFHEGRRPMSSSRLPYWKSKRAGNIVEVFAIRGSGSLSSVSRSARISCPYWIFGSGFRGY